MFLGKSERRGNDRRRRWGEEAGTVLGKADFSIGKMVFFTLRIGGPLIINPIKHLISHGYLMYLLGMFPFIGLLWEG